MIWKPLVEILVKLIEKVAGFLTAFFMGRGYERARQTKKDKQDADNAAHDWADRPRSSNEFSDRLRKLADKQRKDNP